MSAKYIFRLDDACETMNHARWNRVESILDKWNIVPLVAVVPDNHDPELIIDSPSDSFWNKVRSWERKNWGIAMHGYQHVFHPVNRDNLIFPYYDKSEFAGLNIKDQSMKIKKSWEIFQKNGVLPTVWVAPAHCFDVLTIEALRNETPIRIISDGVTRKHFYENGFLWIPQQLWKLTPKKTGLWTLCLHPNNMTDVDIDNFESEISKPYFRKKIISIHEISFDHREKSIVDRVYSSYVWKKGGFLRRLIKIRNFLRGSKQCC